MAFGMFTGGYNHHKPMEEMEVLLGKSWIPNKWTHFTQINGGYPNSWMVYLLENPSIKWMRTGGTPMIIGKIIINL